MYIKRTAKEVQPIAYYWGHRDTARRVSCTEKNDGVNKSDSKLVSRLLGALDEAAVLLRAFCGGLAGEGTFNLLDDSVVGELAGEGIGEALYRYTSALGFM
jgi:hypothetical protein